MHDLVGSPLVGHSTIDPLSTGKIGLLDADWLKYVITHRVFKSSEGKKHFVDPIPILEKELARFFGMVADPVIFCFSGPSSNTFRYGVGFEKEYKGNRRGKEDPYHYDRKTDDMMAILEHIQKTYVSLMFPDLEADDIVSALQDDRTYIISRDKDLLQVPGHHYDPSTNGLKLITNEEALQSLASQMITGDNTDNISGIPGRGPKAAEKLINESQVKNLPMKVLRMYMEKYGILHGLDAFCENYMLIKVREDRGEHFRDKYRLMFDTKEMVFNNLKKQAGL